MKVVAVIQARMGSTRLPGKVMMKLCGKSVLEHVIMRVRACPRVDEVVVATTTNPRDNVIVEEAGRCGVETCRGSEQNVLSRYYEAAKRFKANVIVRVTSDCPLFDPDLLGLMIHRFIGLLEKGKDVDYLSNTLTRTYPRGLDAELFTMAALEKAHSEASRDIELEHVTPYIWKNPGMFQISEYKGEENLSNHRWTLDTPEDLELISNIYNALCFKGEIFSTERVLELLREHPELSSINVRIEQKKLGESN